MRGGHGFRAVLGVIGASLLFLGGCSSQDRVQSPRETPSGTPSSLQASARVRTPVMPRRAIPRRSDVPSLLPVPLVRQATDYTCGVSALQAVLQYYGVSYREDVLARTLKADPQKGTDCKEIRRFAESLGFTIEERTGMSLDDLRGLLDRRLPVIVLLQAWPDHPVDYASDWEDGHYAVAVGYDEANLYFMDPSTLGNYTYIPNARFVVRWHDRDDHSVYEHYGMAVSKPRSAHDPEAILLLE